VPDESVVLDELPAAVVVLRGATVVAATVTAAALLDVAVDDLVGSDLADRFELADRPSLEARLRSEPTIDLSAPADPDPAAPEVEARTEAPGHRPIALAVHHGIEQTVVVLRDVSLERRLSAIIHAVADSTLLVDADGQWIWQTDDVDIGPTGRGSGLRSHPVERLHPEDMPLVLEAFSTLSDLPEGRIDRVVRARAVADEEIWQLIELIGASRVTDPDLGGVVVQVRMLDSESELASIGHTDGPMLSLAEAAPVGILLMNQRERVMYATAVSRSLLAFGPTEDVTAWRERVAPSHRSELDELVDQGLGGAPSMTITAPFELPDAARLWMRVRVAPHRDSAGESLGAIVSLEDVTAEVEARAESERLVQMLDVTSDYVAIFRPNGEILHTNAALAQLLADNVAAGGSGRLGDLLEDRDRFIRRGMEAIATTDTWQGEITLNVSHGRTIPVSVTGVVRRDDEGELDWIAMVARDISDLKEAEQRLRRLATSDHLTGLANRALFTEQLDRAVAQVGATGQVAVLFCDLDRFKEVNDEFGHVVGDKVLVEIADRLRTIVRGDDLVARVGGDEFVILCHGADDPDKLAALAARIIETVHGPIAVDGLSVHVGISIGVAMGGLNPVTGDRILTVADQAMYRAKATGGNRYRVVDIDAE
jgi:diguanylate cyclase (GGDEF)-like protein/PAS domain S-box-containing protein